MNFKESTLVYTSPHNFLAIDSNNFSHVISSRGIEGVTQIASTPMDLMLQSVAGCSGIDVSTILLKKRKTIEGLEIHIKGERREAHPQIFTKVHIYYALKSPDASIDDLNRAIQLSQEKYCGASEMFRMAGVELTWSMSLNEK